MKVLILGSKEYPFGVTSDTLPSGGMECFIQELAPQFKKIDINPIIITRKLRKLPKFEMQQGIEIHRVHWFRGFWLRGPSFNLFSFIKSLALDFDIILTNGIQATFFGFLLSKIRRKPIVALPHGILCTQDRYGKIITKVAYFLEKILYSNTNVVVFSEDSRNKMAKLFNINNITIVPAAVDVKRFNPSKKTKRIITIAYVGRLTQVKGIDYLLEAIPKLKGSFRLLIPGSGSEEESYKQKANQLGILDRVKFLGFVPDVKPIYESTDIFVLPSLSEGLPLVLLEAMAAGCACVVTDIGLPVKNGENALVVKPANSEELAVAINKLILDPRLRKKLASAARTYVEKFSWDKAAQKFKLLFDSLNK